MFSTDSRPHFHPHRVYPRRTRLVMGASRIAGVTEALVRWAPRIALNTTPSISEDPGTVEVLSTRLVVCGIPRSGTTYLSRAAEMFLAGDGAVWKSHDPFVGRDFLPRGIPVIITLRPPLEHAIAKAIFHEDPVTPASLARRLALITAWYRLMAREPRHELLRAWDFSDIISDPDYVLRTTLRQSSAAPIDSAAVENHVGDDDARREVASPHTHIPHADRAQLRAHYENFVEDAKVCRYLALTLEAQERVRQNHST
ncbi:MAG TPA: hypothetical protein DCQ36_05370 [Actinobacteria bacterium]|nr:hypothetical protein [Actinomycetota bacterium]